ncbi:hypothetical protein CGC20_29320 [Leishmania donovani]|uniref:Uncharacterized protein n=1 Tax=Leishmania donovani TaxID=5661 RepID=A0A504X070_LEIDO|nr:hypothetical protein CGC20_29320 [Leishmania donovani]
MHVEHPRRPPSSMPPRTRTALARGMQSTPRLRLAPVRRVFPFQLPDDSPAARRRQLWRNRGRCAVVAYASALADLFTLSNGHAEKLEEELIGCGARRRL